MKVGVFLGGHMPTAGGGFTFQDDVLQAIARLESKHTFVVFGSPPKSQTIEATGKQIQFVALRNSLIERVKTKLTGLTNAVAKLPLIRILFQAMLRRKLSQLIHDLGIEFMWFVTPNYVEVDIPYIFTVWDLQHRLQPWFPEVTAHGEWDQREQLYSTGIRRASAVIIGTSSGREEIIDFYGVPSQRVKLIPHPTPRFALDASSDKNKQVLTKYSIPEGYLFYPGQFWPHKNHVGLLLAVSILRKDYGLVFPVVFVGSDIGGNLQHVQRLVDRLGLSAQVHFLGFVPREDLIGLYRNAFALTYMTFFGPENLPPLEAFALGCPVIASNVSGAQEQLGDAALLVDPKDERQIADAIKQLYDDPALRDGLVSRGMARASKWTAEDFVRSVSSLIDEFEPIRRCWGSKQ